MSSDAAGSLRINHFLARSGVASRRGAEALVLEGRVTVNGQVVRGLATLVDPERDAVKVDGNRVHLLKTAAYYVLYKPKEVVSTLDDPEGRPCLSGFLPQGAKGLFPVGRLDYHSEGLLLLTSDGELSNRLLHPRYKVIKTYQVKVKGDPPHDALERLRRGIVLEGRRTQPVSIRRIPSRETRHTWLQVEMTEGRKNQIREMFFRIEHPVIKLKRVAMGPVRLGKMRPGEVRPLTPEEENALKVHAGLEGAAPPPERNPWDRRPPPARSKEGAAPSPTSAPLKAHALVGRPHRPKRQDTPQKPSRPSARPPGRRGEASTGSRPDRGGFRPQSEGRPDRPTRSSSDGRQDSKPERRPRTDSREGAGRKRESRGTRPGGEGRPVRPARPATDNRKNPRSDKRPRPGSRPGGEAKGERRGGATTKDRRPRRKT